MTAKFTAQEMLGYRDSVVQCLKNELELLDDMHQYGMFNKDEGLITRENYPHKVEIIKGEITKLENFDVVLSVVGTMKAGKSTTINAIVGREILPNRNRPMTALPTLIYHTPEQIEPVLSFHNAAVNEFVGKLKTHLQTQTELQIDEMKELIAKIQAGWAFQPEYHGEKAIFEFLFDLNDLVRLAGYINDKDKSIEFPFTKCRNIEQLPQIKVAFRHLTDMPANQGRLVLLDTPGPNEAGQEHLREMLDEQLQRSSAVMLVLDYTQLKSEASDNVKKQLGAVSTVSKERLFALVNKFDQKNANSDDEEQTKNLIFQEFLPEKIEREHIYPLAAQTAFLANRMAAELASKGKPEWTEGGWFNDFIRLAYGTRMKANKWEHEEIEDIQEAIDELIEDSRVQVPLQEAIIQTQMEAPKIALQAAIRQLDEVLYNVYNFTHVHANDGILNSDKEMQVLQSKLVDLHKQVEKLDKLQQKTAKELPEKLQVIHAQLTQVLDDTEQSLKQTLDKDQAEKAKKLRTDVNDLKIKTGLFSGFDIWGEKRKKDQEEIAELLVQIENIVEGVSIFHKRDEAEIYFMDMKKKMQGQIEAIIGNIQQQVGVAQNMFKGEIEQIQTECHAVFDEIHRSLEKEGFELHKPDFQTKALRDYALQFPEIGGYVKEKQVSVKKEKDYAFASVVRWLGEILDQDDWGYEHVNKIRYEVSGDEIKKAFVEPIEDYLKQVQGEIKQLFEEFESEWIDEYIGNIQNQATNLLDEVGAAIQANIDNQHRAEEYRNKMKYFAKRNGDISEDYEKVAKVINAM